MTGVPLNHPLTGVSSVKVNPEELLYSGQPGAFAFVAVPCSPGSSCDKAYEVVRYDLFVSNCFQVCVDPPSEQGDRLKAALGISSCALKLRALVDINLPATAKEKLIEELGDLRFYVQAFMNLLGVSEQEVLQKNAIKLANKFQGV